LKWTRTRGLNDWGKWSTTIYPDKQSLEIVRGLQAEGLKNVLKKDDDGYFVSFSRPYEKEFKDKKTGIIRKMQFTPVQVIMKDGTPFDELIGEGTDAVIKLEVYSHGTPGGGKAKAARLMSIRIDNLVPYSRKDYDEDQEKAVKGLEKQPTQPMF
jgi:hypothetical protein